jgi:hypothetical protein
MIILYGVPIRNVLILRSQSEWNSSVRLVFRNYEAPWQYGNISDTIVARVSIAIANRRIVTVKVKLLNHCHKDNMR